MAIIENAKYNSLPEQVEENKDNIKKLDDAIAEIDPEAITAVIDQVATNTSDISNIKGEQITQNNNIGLNALAITSEATNRKALIDVDASGNTEVKAQAGKDIDLYSSNKIHLYGDKGGNLSDDYGDEVSVLKDKIILETTSHDVILNEDGTLKMDSNKIAENGHLTFENIYDNNGNKRFFSNAGETTTISGVTFTFSEYSLSGNHVMFVVAGTIANGTSLNSGAALVAFNIPHWLYEKIYNLFDDNIDIKKIPFVNPSNFSTQEHFILLTKIQYVDKIMIRLTGQTFTASADRNFRIQFDLTIDNE